MEIYIFTKKNNKVDFLLKIEGEDKEEIIKQFPPSLSQLKNNYINGFLDFPNKLQREDYPFRYDYMCQFIIDTREKAEKFLKDEKWIQKIREEGKKLFPNDPNFINYFCEMHRNYRKGLIGEKGFNSCISKIRNKIPNFIFERISFD